MTNTSKLYMLLAVLSFGAFVGWRLNVAKHAPRPTHIVEVLDVSSSMLRSCDEDVSAIRGALRAGGVKRGSTLTLIRTGAASTNQEPRLVFREPIPTANANAFGGKTKAQELLDGFIDRAKSACEGVPQTKHSPIVKAVRRGLAELKGLGCQPDAGCVLIVHSDLRDNDTEELVIGHKNHHAPSRLDNSGIRVVLCGFTASVADGSAVNTDSLLTTWQALFIQPVKAVPFCGEGDFATTSTTNPERKYFGMTEDAHARGRPPTDSVNLDSPLLPLSPVDHVSLRDSFEGTFICSSSGGGKTANIGKNLAYALVGGARAGGLILTAKAEETQNWINLAKKCGREQDLIVFNAASGHAFDPLYYEWSRPGRGAADLESIIDLFSTLLSISKKESGHGHDPFWERGNEQLMRNVIKLLDLAGERISIVNIDRVVKSLPSRLGEHEEAQWQKESFCASLINAIRDRQSTLTSDQWSDLDVATQYIFKRWPGFDERPRSSLEMTWSGMADKFLFSPYSRLFSGGKCTFVPEMTTHQGRILIVDFPLLEYGHETGRLINVLMKLVFQRAWLRRKLSESGKPCFLWQDEFQYFVTRRDNAFQQTCRGARIANVCITQNILNLAEELGEQQPGSKTKAFLGNLMLKIFGQQNDPDTNEYAASLIAKEWRYIDSFNGANNGGPSVGGSNQLVYKVDPGEFTQLLKPDGRQPYCEAIVYQGGKIFNATRNARDSQGKNHLRVRFSRDI